MNLRNRLTSKNEAGFTLAELMAVIAILSILSAIAVPAFLNQRKVAQDSSVESHATMAWGVVTSLTGPEDNLPASLTEAKVKGLGTVEGLKLGLVQDSSGSYCVLGYQEGSNYDSPDKAFEISKGGSGVDTCSIPYTNVVWE